MSAATGHRCPRVGCTVEGLPAHLFACRPDWFALSSPVRRAIYATRALPILHPDRQAVFAAAHEEWGDR